MVILTAIRLELDAVLKVDAGAVKGSAWEVTTSPNGLPIAFRSFETRRGRPLRVAVAVSPDMGATAALTTLLPLIQSLGPRCIAMCGVCASRRGKTNLGDVVATDRLFFYDTGKELPGGVEGDLNVYKLRDDWKTTLEGMDAVAQFRDAKWFRDRPLSTEQREQRALVALRDASPEPWRVVDPELEIPAWQKIVASLRQRKWLTASGLKLTAKGRRAVEDLLIDHMGKLPDPSPAGTFQPFRLHVAPIGPGSRVVENEEIWAFISRSMRKALGLEVEAAALGELAHRLRQERLDFIVMKGVMDFANRGRDDHFKAFAARARPSACCGSSASTSRPSPWPASMTSWVPARRRRRADAHRRRSS